MKASGTLQPTGWGSRFVPPLRRPSLRAALAAFAIVAAVLAASWAVLGRGGTTVVNGPVAAFAPVAETQALPSFNDLLPVITRFETVRSDLDLDVIYTPPFFYRVVDQEPPAASQTQPSAVFVLRESSHIDDLLERPDLFLLGPDGERVAAYDIALLSEDPHHRSTRFTFRVEGGALGERATVVAPAGAGSTETSFVWDLPLLVPGAEAATAAAAGEGDATQPAFAVSDLAKALQREQKGVAFAGVDEIEFTATYATPEYFAAALPASVAERFDPAGAVVLLVSESTHERNLPDDLMPLRLSSGGREVAPDLVEPRIASPHHRVTMMRFPIDPEGALQNGSMTLLLPDGGSVGWTLPVTYDAATTPFGVTWATLLAVMAGLLAAMWPCLFQLTAFFIPTLAGVSASEVDGRVTFGGHMKVMKAALYFVLGFTIVYTLAGAAIGFAAGRFADAADFERYQRYLAMGGGVIILVLAVRIAAKARAPLVCKMPVLSGMGQKPGGGSPREMMFAGLAFATGCMTCFGAAMVITMVIYVGLNGSMFFGALVMFLFSLGMGVPLVIAAVAMARVLPLLFRLERMVPMMGLASSVLMVGFAILLITGNYMILTEWIYRLTGNPLAG